MALNIATPDWNNNKEIKVNIMERDMWHRTFWGGRNVGETESSGASTFCRTVPGVRDAVCPHSENSPDGYLLPFSQYYSIPVLHLYECSSLTKLIKQSVFLLFAFIQFCIEKIHFSRCLFTRELISTCSYMCWASIMSKYLASMIRGSTLFLQEEEKTFSVSHGN